MTFLPQDTHFLFCSHHLTLCILIPLATYTSEMSLISLSFDDTETETLQESMNEYIRTKKVFVCAPVHAHIQICIHGCKHMRARTCMYVCAYEMLGLSVKSQLC